MPGPDEKATDQARRDLIVIAARELAEVEGWSGVSTRRLAERTEIDMGEVYRHFADLEALLAAVAVCAFADLAADLAEAHAETADSPEEVWSAVASAYLDFAYTNPEVYDAMLALTPTWPSAWMVCRPRRGGLRGAAGGPDPAGRGPGPGQPRRGGLEPAARRGDAHPWWPAPTRGPGGTRGVDRATVAAVAVTTPPPCARILS
ncbi:TetR/AcrR family transcriptional regulator [Micromonospora sp. M12]